MNNPWKAISLAAVAGVTFGSIVLSAAALSSAADEPTTKPSSIAVVKAATKERKAKMIGRIASLAGTWEKVADPTNTGDMPGKIVFAKTAAGSAVREVMFPGSPFEMTNLYHMNGPDLVVTHYCASGNQPRMVCAEPSGDDNEFKFTFESATNVLDASTPVMAELTLKLSPDGQTLKEIWKTTEDGKVGETVEFTLKRVPDAPAK